MTAPPIVSALKVQSRVLGIAMSVLLVASLVAAARQAPESPSELARHPGGSGAPSSVLGETTEIEGTIDETLAETPGAQTPGATRGQAVVGGTPATPSLPPAGTVIPGEGLVPPGVSDTEIKVVYYWKGDRTQASPYLRGTGQDGNLDEGEAFRHLINYLNMHADGGATFMGFPFNLHGRKFVGEVLDAGQYPDTYGATAEHIARQIKPFSAVSSHGSLSAYICPYLAEAGIHNTATYDLAPNLSGRTNGYCLPQGPTWDAQVDFSTNYLAWHAKNTTYSPGNEPRVYGVLYAEYPGLVDSAPVMVERLKRAGVNVASVQTLAADLGTAQQQAPTVVGRFRAADVNTVVMPDAGAPLNFTHAAQASGYTPDYFVWPCSGQDSLGMVRLFNDAQWTRASGLTCYDEHFNADLVNDGVARQSEWYQQYQESAGSNAEPPAPTSIVYAALLPLVVGVTNAGPTLTVENFREGISALEPYRYDAIEGRTNDPKNLLVTIGAPDRSFMGDVAKIRWSATARRQGSAAPGNYVYPEDRRYQRGAHF